MARSGRYYSPGTRRSDPGTGQTFGKSGDGYHSARWHTIAILVAEHYPECNASSEERTRIPARNYGLGRGSSQVSYHDIMIKNRGDLYLFI